MFLIMATDFDNLERDLVRFVDFETVKNKNIKVFIAPVDGQDVIFSDAGETKAEVAKNFSAIESYFNIDGIIGIGNCASLQSNRACIGDVMICTDVIQYDIDCSPLGYSIGEVPQLGKIIFYSNESLINTAISACKDNKYDYSLGRVISADRFNSDTSEANKLRAEFSCDFLDMECGVLGELAYIYKIPSVVVKGVSNYGNDDAVKNYNTYRKNANIISLEVAFTMLGILNCNKK